ncbi:hybrid sensor histidine kinase/response regulator [Desulfogranum japonicum]|uniref:hybrid sensor histidine kinase/response regulator n=1 Tax=Desulfogranum japonicum TaxID=231447 RepID=UPI00041EAF69|nr:ATP-binding protein [Desulfogranum japonicum]
MKKHSDASPSWELLRDGVVGLGERSARKSYYPELRSKVEDLNRQRNFYQSTLNSIPDAVLVTDHNDIIIECNPAFCQIFGYPADAVNGMPSALVLEEEPSAFRSDDYLPETSRRFKKGDNSTFVGEYRRNDIRNDKGELLGHLEIIRDLSDYITAVKKQRQLEDQLRQSQKMEAIGTLAAGIAHDFNNLLSAILGYAELAHQRHEPDAQALRYIEQIMVAGNKASDLVHQILAFSRKEKKKRSAILLAPLMHEAMELLRASTPATVNIVEDLEDTDKLILADAGQLHQVFINLYTNAFHAMEEYGGGTLHITMRCVHEQNEEDGATGEYFKITVADTGPGISPDVMNRMYEPYFTTKGHAKGTGLGLCVVHGIVEGHKGRIYVQSDAEQGTVFTLFFPVANEKLEAEQRRETDTLVGGNESIMLVDDEKMIVEYIRTFLSQLGYQVMSFHDGKQALQAFEQGPEDFDIIVTDLTMPVMSGMDLAEKVLKIRKDMPIVLCSGYSSPLSPERASNLGIREFLIKPISLYQLAPVLRRILDSACS